MDIFVSVIAVAIAFACLIALFIANYRDHRRQQHRFSEARAIRASRRATTASKYSPQIR